LQAKPLLEWQCRGREWGHRFGNRLHPAQEPAVQGYVRSFCEDAETGLVRLNRCAMPKPCCHWSDTGIGHWIEDYNENHPHSVLKWRSPRAFIRVKNTRMSGETRAGSQTLSLAAGWLPSTLKAARAARQGWFRKAWARCCYQPSVALIGYNAVAASIGESRLSRKSSKDRFPFWENDTTRVGRIRVAHPSSSIRLRIALPRLPAR